MATVFQHAELYFSCSNTLMMRLAERSACLVSWKNSQAKKSGRSSEVVPAEQLERVQHEERRGTGLMYVLIKM